MLFFSAGFVPKGTDSGQLNVDEWLKVVVSTVHSLTYAAV